MLPLHVTVIPDGAAGLDVGSGAGLPGIPIAICRPDVAMTLVESNRKKFLFLHHLIQSLPLPNARALLERVETLADHPLHAHTYDVAFVRAVGSLAAMVPAVFPLLKPGGHLVMHKGPDASQEIADAADVLAPWAGCVEQCVSMTLPELPMTSTIVVVRKGTV